MAARLDPDAIRSLLAADHGIDAGDVVPGERGTVAETWVASGPRGRWFVKVVPIGRDSPALERSLPVQDRLWSVGFRQMARPVAAVDGSLSVRRGGHVVAVFDWIDGVATQDYPFDAYVDLLAELHGTVVDVGDAIDQFTDDTTARVGPFLEHARRERRRDALTESVGAVLDGLGSSLDHDIREARRIGASLAARTDLTRVLTHYDTMNNVLIRPDGRLVLVDWDDLLLAPPERDAWSHLVHDRRAAPYLRRYRRWVPTYEPDPDAILHYLRKWYFEEIEGLGTQVLDLDRPVEQRQRYVGWISEAVPYLATILRRIERGERPWASAVAEATSPPSEHGQRQADEQHRD